MPRRVDPSPGAIREAAQRLDDGGIVVFPTETVYGLGADTFNQSALRSVYELKGRPIDNPLIAHVRSVREARRVVATWDERVSRLAEHFWPGPLSMILPRHQDVPAIAAGGRETIAVRCPNHPVARDLLEAFGGPISAPSANRSGHVSPTLAEHVASDFAGVDDLLILDGGPCQMGIESTVLDLTRTPAVILRPGSVSAETLSCVLGESVVVAPMAEQADSPGTSALHYAPRTPLSLLSRDELLEQLSSSREPLVAMVIGWLDVSPPHRLLMMPAKPTLYAAMLYDALRKADLMSCRRILVEQPYQRGDLWDAVRDRLQRAAGQV